MPSTTTVLRSVSHFDHMEVLKTAFELIQNPEDWRAPIDAEVPTCYKEIYIEAIKAMTATDPRVIEVRPGRTRLTSIGYRMGPAGP